MNPVLAQIEINKMRGALGSWLKWRGKLMEVARGKTPGNADLATQALKGYHPEEVALAKKLEELLEAIEPGEDFSGMDPVELAQYTLKDQISSPTAQGGVLTWVVAGGTLILLFTVKTLADSASEKRKLEACKSGISEACPFNWKRWLFIGSLGLGAYLLWAKTDFKTWLGGVFKTERRQLDD
jgi:hypothetical protein